MIITTLGIIHFIHSPLLIIFPFIVENNTMDIIYIMYFFGIMFLYTFIDGECPISYLAKIIDDRNYTAGKDITHYPEMERILNVPYIDYYFPIMTTLYLFSLVIVILRTKIHLYWFICPLLFVFVYFLFIREIVFIHLTHFNIFQEITKYVLLFTICILSGIIILNS